MALTTGDLQAIGSLMEERLEKQDERIDQKFGAQAKRIDQKLGALTTNVENGFRAQNQFLTRSFEDVKAVMQQAYVSREEFEELKSQVEELQTELDQLKKPRPATP